MKQIDRVTALMDRVQVSFFGSLFIIRVSYDIIASEFNPIHEPRVFIQMMYTAPDTKNGPEQEWKGRKWYLSEYMTDDEIIKTAYLAFRTCIEHEILESFKIDGTILFNPHVNFEVLLLSSHMEVKRENHEYTPRSQGEE